VPRASRILVGKTGGVTDEYGGEAGQPQYCFSIFYQMLMRLFAAFGSYRKGAFSMPVNQLVVGSIPTAGAIFSEKMEIYQGFE
jgi:hypothetical protein